MKKILLIALISSLSTLCEGQFQVLYNCSATNGEYPAGSVTFSKNKLYVMSQAGGAKNVGDIFSIDTNGNGYRDLHDFDTAQGEYSQGSLTLIGDKLYGEGNQGGVFGAGILFSIDTNGTGFKDLHDFNTINGYLPAGSLILFGDRLYGVTQAGGAHNDGVVFSIDTNGSGYMDLLDFNGANGSSPEDAAIAISGGKLFGMTQYGGANDSGCVFTIDTNGHNYKDILNFNVANGSTPFATSLVISGNVLYGMATKGGANHKGCVFSVDTNGSGYSDLLDFTGGNGAGPESGLILVGNTLIGTTFTGGLNTQGCIFSINTNGSGYKDLFDFSGTNGGQPWNMLLTPFGSTLFGTTSFGGTNHEGIIFSFKDIGLGINNLPPTTSSINVYPNPSSGVFTLQVESEKVKDESGMIEVYNVLGEKVYTQRSPINTHLIIDLSNQPNGIYLYRVIGDNGGSIGEGKLIIQSK